MGRCEELETQQQRLRQELVNATEAREKSGQQMAELQTRTRQAQERPKRSKGQKYTHVHISTHTHIKRDIYICILAYIILHNYSGK